MSKKVARLGRRGKGVECAGGPGREGLQAHPAAWDTRAELIQALIPIGLEAVNELFQRGCVSWPVNVTAARMAFPATLVGVAGEDRPLGRIRRP